LTGPIRRTLASPWIAYLAIAALQLKVMWGAWLYRDLTSGDTVAYYLYATWWAKSLQVNLVWSPLYTAFYGTVLAAFPDAYAATILHRLLIAVAASLLVLALVRRLLPGWLAWLVAAWWTVLPINFDAVYEVHLFAVLPLLVAFWVVAAWPGPWGRGFGLGILLTAALLSRNETLLPYLGLAAYYVGRELRRRPAGASFVGVLRPYVVPSLLALALFGSFYARSRLQFPELWAGYGPKHTVNMCQVFATGYGQRHPGWGKNPMTECTELMVANFGAPAPTLWQMMRANPRAVLQHFAWNASLTPNGVQVMLFDRVWGTTNPDYFPVQAGSGRALWLGLLTIATLLTAAALVASQPRWRRFLRRRREPWLFLFGTTLPLAAIVILTQRPRPSYLFSLSVALMALVGLAAAVVLRTAFGKRRVGGFAVAAAIALIALAPLRYRHDPVRDRYLLHLYRRINSISDLVADGRAVFVVRHYGTEIAHYVGRGHPRGIEHSGWLPSDQVFLDRLEAEGANLFYVDDRLANELGPSSVFYGRRPGPPGWELVCFGEETRGRWRMWARSAYVDLIRQRPPALPAS
jgi:hypothetical protein